MRPPFPTVYWLGTWQPQAPVMVSGQGRSGTTALVRALASAGLAPFWEPGSAGAEELEMLRAWERGESATIARLVTARRALGQWVSKVPNAAIWAANRSGLANAWGGNWAIITRDPLAMVAHDLTREEAATPSAVGYRLHYRVAGYAQTVGAAQRLADGWGVVVVSFEKLLTDPATVLRDLSAHLPILDIPAGVDEIRAGDARYYRYPNPTP